MKRLMLAQLKIHWDIHWRSGHSFDLKKRLQDSWNLRTLYLLICLLACLLTRLLACLLVCLLAKSVCFASEFMYFISFPFIYVFICYPKVPYAQIYVNEAKMCMILRIRIDCFLSAAGARMYRSRADLVLRNESRNDVGTCASRIDPY